MAVLVDLTILMEVFLPEVMALHLIGRLEVLVVGLAIMVVMEVEMISVVVLEVMEAVVVLVVMRAIEEENLHSVTLVAMAPIWGALVVDLAVVG